VHKDYERKRKWLLADSEEENEIEGNNERKNDSNVGYNVMKSEV